MRSIWNGAITFGLITIPVRLFSAVDEKSPSFNQLHEKDNARIRYKRVCSDCGEEVSTDDIVKGYEFEKDQYVVFSSEEVSRIPSDNIRAIDILQFVKLEEIDPVYFQRPYYLSPEKTGIKAYQILSEALKKSGKVGLAKVALRDKERLAVLRLKDDVFVLETMYWPDEIREPEFEELESKANVTAAEKKLALDIVDNLTDAFKPADHVDSYRERIEAAVQAKIDGQEIAVSAQRAPTQVVDLMEALKASVEQTKKKTKEKASAKAG